MNAALQKAPPKAQGITPEQWAQARLRSRQELRPMVELLEEICALEPGDFTAALATHFSYPPIDMKALQLASPAFDAIPYSEAMTRAALALRSPAGGLLLVIGDPFDEQVEAWARQRLGRPFEVRLAHPADVSAWLAHQEKRLRAMDSLLENSSQQTITETLEDISLLRISADQSTAVKLVNYTLYDALKMQASDIHLEREPGGLIIKYRIDGVLIQIGTMQGGTLAEQVVSRIKVLSALDISEQRIPQDGRFKVSAHGRDVDFRVSIMPNIFGEDAVLRLLDRSSLSSASTPLRLDHLGLKDDILAVVRMLSRKPHGMFLVTGPTGSGKTTTLYAAISEINSGRDKIATIEDPVEYRIPQVLQIPVNEKQGLTFASGLRSLLRHDPDKIMVGEIRDNETATIAVQAALTGHLVFTTVHANSVFDVIGRLLHMEIDPYSLAAALNGVLAQRLLRLNCTHCSTENPPTPTELEHSGLTAPLEGWRFQAGRGCGRCRGTGYQGRKAVAQSLVLDDSIRTMISTKAPLEQLKQAAEQHGTRSLREAALDLVRNGETTLEEADRATF